MQQTSKTGVRGIWPVDPNYFVVISVRRPKEVRPPVIIEGRGGHLTTTLKFSKDMTGATKRIRVFRTRDIEHSSELRLMKPVGDIDVAASGDDEIVFVDTGLYADVPYFYRAIGFGDGNARSDETGAVAVTPWSNAPPPPAQILNVKSGPLAGNRTLTFTLPRRDYRVTVFRRVEDGLPLESDRGRPRNNCDAQHRFAPYDADRRWLSGDVDRRCTGTGIKILLLYSYP